ncbi:MAG: hypothetical protein GWP50_07300 [Proteobacteria bacterium]|nr:hypothetical protein [Pseudomonadota bacterium]
MTCSDAYAVFTLWSLAMMVYGVRWAGSVRDGKLYESVDFHTVRCLQALAGFGAGFKILYFLRGMDFASFLINMLEHIIYGAPSPRISIYLRLFLLAVLVAPQI